jgi:O-antigen/teichoic acid export membrane protein
MKNLIQNISGPFFSATAKKGYSAFIDQGLVSGTNFLTGVLLARLCAKEEYGLYVLTLSLLFFWDGLRNSLISSPLVVYLPRKPAAERPSYIGSTTFMQALFMLTGAIVFGAAAAVIKVSGDAPLTLAILAAIFALCGYSSREHIRQVFYAQLRVRYTVLVDGAYCLLQFGALALLWRFNILSAVNALLWLGASQTSAALLGLLLLSGEISPRNLNFRTALYSHWKLGKWLVATSAAYVLANQMYPWFLRYLSALEATAIFGACVLLTGIVNPFTIAFNNVLVPRLSYVFAREGLPGLRRVIRKAQTLMVAATAIVATFIIIFSRPILDVVYRGKYSDNSAILSILALQLVITSVATPLSAAFLVMEKPHLGFYTAAASAFCTLTVGLALVYYAGVTGAALGTVLGGVLVASTAVLLYRRAASALQGSMAAT